MTTGLRILVAAVMVVLIGALMVGYMFVAFLLPNVWQTADRAFLRRRLGEDCPWWPVGVPVVFAFLVVGLIVLLLPGCQHSEKQDYESKVIVLFDLSGSMFVRDDLPEIGQDLATLPSRPDKIVNFLRGKEVANGRSKEAFIDRVLEKTPLTC